MAARTSRPLLALRHAVLVAVSFVMLLPFYWVIKTAITNENIYAYPPGIVPRDPHLFNFVDVWYLIPFPRYLLNSVIVSAIAVAGNVVLNAMAGYALTRQFPGRRAVLALFLSCMLIPFQATIIPAYLITAKMGLLNTFFGLAFPMLSTIICIFVFKAAFEAVPRSLIDAARLDGLSEWRIILRVLLPLSKPAIATNVILVLHLVVEQLPLAAAHHPRPDDADAAARPRALPLRTWRTPPARCTRSPCWCWPRRSSCS